MNKRGVLLGAWNQHYFDWDQRNVGLSQAFELAATCRGHTCEPKCLDDILRIAAKRGLVLEPDLTSDRRVT